MADPIKSKLNSILKESEIVLEKRMDMDKTLEQNGSRIEKRLQGDNSAAGKTPTDFLNACLEVDPSAKKDFWYWIMNTYISGGIQRYEDLYKVSEPLAIFAKHKQRLPQDQRDILKYRTYIQLRDAVAPFADVKSNKETKRDAFAELFEKGEASMVLDNAKWRVAIPHTENAACQLGQNTEWCTSAKNNSLFDHYNKDGDLYIILKKGESEGARWQFQWEGMQFMDEHDHPVSLYQFFKENGDLLQIPAFGEKFEYVPEGYKLTIPEKRQS